MPPDGFLRQGCLLTPDPDYKAEWVVVARSGQRTPVALTAERAYEYAAAAASSFGVGSSKTVRFEKERAKEDLVDKKKAKKPSAKAPTSKP